MNTSIFKKPGIISQVRMTSTRLPGKVLKMINGKSLLDYHVDRLKWAQLPIIIATTTNHQDDLIQTWCTEHKITCFRGSENNVLSRYYLAAKENNLDVIIRVTSDCPLIDGHLIRQAYNEYLNQNNSDLYYSNVIERTYPRGFDFEIFSFKQLEQAFLNAQTEPEKEHVTPYINQNKNGSTQFLHFKNPTDYSSWRMTVDTPDDFKLIEELIQNHHCDRLAYSEITKVLDQNIHLKEINNHIEQKKI